MVNQDNNETENHDQAAEIAKVAGTEVTFEIPNTEELGELKNMAATFNLRLKYKTAEDWAMIKGKPLRAYFLGTRLIPNEKEENILCAVFASSDEVFICAQRVLIDAVKTLPIKTALQITYLEKKTNKTVAGETMIFDIQLLK